MHQGQITELRIRVAELERIVDHLVGHLGVQVPAASSTVSAAVLAARAAAIMLSMASCGLDVLFCFFLCPIFVLYSWYLNTSSPSAQM